MIVDDPKYVLIKAVDWDGRVNSFNFSTGDVQFIKEDTLVIPVEQNKEVVFEYHG